MNKATYEINHINKMVIRELLENSFISHALVVILMSAVFVVFYLLQKNIYSNKLLESQLIITNARINSHFVSNSLNAIESLVNQGRNEEASEYLIDFSALFRKVINQLTVTEISLNEELKTLRLFLSLESLRLPGDFQYEILIDPRLDIKVILVPPGILQPLVENSIWHGIINKPKPRNGELKIKINMVSEYTIEYIIEDNGVGRHKAKDLQKQTAYERESHGIDLINKRIEHLLNGRITNLQLTDFHNQNGIVVGTKARIRLPLILIEKE